KFNQADSLIFQSEKQLTEFGDKLPADKKEAIQKSLSELKDAHKERNIASMDAALASLNAAWAAASEEMYKATQNAGATGPDANAGTGGGSGKSDGEVTDVDFEEVKDEKK
ncbi:MAG: Hsp70 family protein, partial [Bacteroidota bacterium]